MNTKTFSESLNEIDSRYLESALAYRNRTFSGHQMKYGIVAACFCLLVCGICFGVSGRSTPAPGPDPGDHMTADVGGGIGTPEPGGHLFPDGVDPVIASIAVYPDSENLQDVENAVINSYDEAALASLKPFCDHLPKNLPENYHFRSASLYETTMKNGTRYHMLRLTYTNGTQQNIETVEIDGEIAAIAPDPNAWGDELTLHMWDFQVGQPIYSPEDVTPELLQDISKTDSLHLYIDHGDLYVGIFPEVWFFSDPVSQEELIKLIRSMQ